MFPDLLGSRTEMAVTVTFSVAPVPGGVYSPAALMEPAVADQVTPVEQASPVQPSVKLHWLVSLDRMLSGVHVAVTDVIVPFWLSLLPPQAASPRSIKMIVMSPSICTGFSL